MLRCCWHSRWPHTHLPVRPLATPRGWPSRRTSRRLRSSPKRRRAQYRRSLMHARVVGTASGPVVLPRLANHVIPGTPVSYVLRRRTAPTAAWRTRPDVASGNSLSSFLGCVDATTPHSTGGTITTCCGARWNLFLARRVVRNAISLTAIVHTHPSDEELAAGVGDLSC